MNYEKIIFECNDGIAKITLNSKKNLNALDESLASDLMKGLDECEKNPDIKVVVLNGAG
jgi:enoyl-CoA hydratase/carnithine racemase